MSVENIVIEDLESHAWRVRGIPLMGWLLRLSEVFKYLIIIELLDYLGSLTNIQCVVPSRVLRRVSLDSKMALLADHTTI
jgi:hypothetical protein